MKKTVIILFVILSCVTQAAASNRAGTTIIAKEKGTKNDTHTREISILDGIVRMELRTDAGDFPAIGIQLSDKNTNEGLGTYLEIKKRGEFYIVEIEYEHKKFRTIDEGIEAYLKDLFKNFYDDKKYGKKVWDAFVKEGGLQLFIDISKEVIDDEFLNSPFNETYG